jgi:hypothetical protein
MGSFRKDELIYYYLPLGVAAAFLILLGSSYLVTGSNIAAFGKLETHNGRLAIYATILELQLILLGKVFSRKSSRVLGIGLIVSA